MKAVFASVLGAAVTLLPLSVASAEDLVERTLTFEARGDLLRPALEKLTAGTETRIEVDPRVPDVPVRLMLRGVTVDHALRLIVRQAARQVPLLTYEATEAGFRLFMDEASGGIPAEAESADRVTFTARQRTQPERTTTQPASPGEGSVNGQGEEAPSLPIGTEPPRIGPTGPRYRFTYIPGWQVYIPPPSPPRRSRDPLDTPIGRGAYKIDGVAKVVGYGIPWRKTEYHLRTRAPLEGGAGGGSGRRRRPDNPNNGGGGAGGDNDQGGRSGGGGGVGRRPF